MLSFLKRYKAEILIGCILFIVYFFLRLTNILHLPIFTDEAIYVRWAQIAKQDANWRFISLTDGKQPMMIWLAMIFLKFIKEPLLATRMVSVFAGFGTIIGLYFIGKDLFKNKWVGLLSASLYVLYPFGLVYDRMALYDSLVTFFAIWSIYIEVLLVQKIRLDLAFIAGLVIGGGVLTKSNAFFNIYFFPVSLLLFNWTKQERLARFAKWTFYAVIATILAYLYYSILRLSPLFGVIDEKNHTFIYPFNEWRMHPFTYLEGNLRGLVDWFITYMTWPMVILIVGSLVVDKKLWKEKLFLLFWFVAPLCAAALFGKTLYPRYVLPMTITLLPLISYLFVWVYNKWKNVIIVGSLFILSILLWIRADYFIVYDFAHAPIPQSDLGQYINDWPAGGGVAESVQFFKTQAENKKIYIATEGTFGLMPLSLEIYLVDNPNITLKGIWPIEDTIPQELVAMSKKMPTYVVFYQPCPSCDAPGKAPTTWPLKHIAEYQKGISTRSLTIYQVIPTK